MKPQKGDKVIIVNGNNKPTHNTTKVGEVLEREGDYWKITDKYKVPMKIAWEGKWVQTL